MPGGYVYVWDAENEAWVKIACTTEGKIKIVSS